MNKKELLKYVNENILEKYDTTYTRAYVSKDKLYIHDIKDIFEKRMFKEEMNVKGWLAFIDPIIIANWSHRCEYYFIVDENNVFVNIYGEWMPHDNIRLEEIKIKNP